jgi:threonine/homoserine/homoserine lactone efflux protein
MAMSQELVVILTAVGLYAALVISPGPNFALVSRLAISGSTRGAAGSALGFGLAAAFYQILTMAGLSLLLTRVGWLASAIQVAGGLYLVYLGIGAWTNGHKSMAEDSRPRDRGFLAGLRIGTLVCLSNPKAIAFFLGLYAAVVPADTPLWVKVTILAFTFAIETGWYLAVVFVFSRRWPRDLYQRFGRWIERVLGVFLAGFGIRLIAEKV